MLHERLQFLRKELNLSQRQFALRLGLDPGYVSRILRGKSVPSERILLLIENLFHVNRKWLDCGEGPVFKDSALSKNRKELLDLIQTLDEEQIQAALAFLHYLQKEKKEA